MVTVAALIDYLHQFKGEMQVVLTDTELDGDNLVSLESAFNAFDEMEDDHA